MANLTPIVRDLIARGLEAGRRGDSARAHELYESAVAEAKRLKDIEGEATALFYWAGLTRASDRDLLTAHRLVDDSMRLFRKIHHDRGAAYAMFELGNIAREEGRYEEGIKSFCTALVTLKKLEDKRGVAMTLHQMGLIAKEKKDFATAEKQWRESLIIFEALGDKYSVGQVLLSLGNAIADHDKDLEQGELLMSRALAIFEELGLPKESEKARRNLAVMHSKDRD